MCLLLQADQRLKQNHEDLPPLVSLQELLFYKEYGLILIQELNKSRLPSVKKTDCSSSSWFPFVREYD